MVVDADSHYAMGCDPRIDCVWVENGRRSYAYFNLWTLQTGHGDGSPRSYIDEK